jgi:hypothetical protein
MKAAAVDSSRRGRRWRLRSPGGAAAPPNEPEEVPPPLPDEPKEALALQPVVVHAPPLNAGEVTWSVNLFNDAFMKLRKVAVHLRAPVPNDPLQRT